jgi:hypothetical protein
MTRGFHLHGETFVNGQGQEEWCNSKVPITNMAMFNKTTSTVPTSPEIAKPSCYALYYNGFTWVMVNGMNSTMKICDPTFSIQRHVICKE